MEIIKSDYVAQLHNIKKSLASIAWYNGIGVELLNLSEDFRDLAYENKKKMKRDNYIYNHNWNNSDLHFFWMLLVGQFGDWGTSINSGWVSHNKLNEAADWIQSIFREYIDEGLYEYENEKWHERKNI